MAPKLIIVDADKPRIEQLCLEGKSKKEIAAEFNCTTCTVWKALKRFDLKTNPDLSARDKKHREKKREEECPILNDMAWLVDQYEVQRKSTKEIGLMIDRAAHVVGYALWRFGIETRKVGSYTTISKQAQREQFKQLFDETWMRQKYVTEDLTMEQIAIEIGCPRINVYRAIKGFGIPLINRGGSRRHIRLRKDAIAQLRDREWMAKEYIENNRTAEDIGNELGCTMWLVQEHLSRLRLLKFPSRPKEKKDKSLAVGVYRTTKGYLRVYRRDHPFATPRGFIYQHRLVAEESLGRYLTDKEQVHHLNEKRDDNRIENLLVMPNYKTHVEFHFNPPEWVPRCECCGKPYPESLKGRPDHIPLLYQPAQT